MKLFKLTVICGSVLSLAGCLSTPTNPDTSYKPAMSAAYVDLLIEKAKAEERARVMAELAEQNKDDKRFSEIKINQLESKIEQLNQSDSSSTSVKQVAPKASVVQAVEPEPVIATAENTSSDPLLEQWKNIYAQEEQKSTIVEEPKQIEVAQVVEKEVKPSEVIAVKEEIIYTPPVYDVKKEAPVVNQVPAVNTFETKYFDTVIRQCVAGQTIPNPYLGSLPKVLNSNAQAGDSIKLPTLCKWSRSPEIIQELQIALSERGFLKPSPPYDLEVIDGIWGVNTLNSLINYQKSKGLAYGQLSIESLVDLGVIQYSDIVNRKGSNKMFKSEIAPDAGVIEKSRPDRAPASTPVVRPIPDVKLAPAIVPEPTVVPVKPEVKAVVTPKPTPPKADVKVESTTDSAPKSVKFEKAETKHCYVNQVIPGDYRGKIAELLQNSKESKVGYVQELPTLCKKDRSTEIITKLQRALYGLGYLKRGVTSINGVWNKNTLNAVRAYQKDKGLAYGQLSIEVLETLGVL
jgi:peptidoglycan hydrolase-like protein with peptidoglycan-binding domain